MSSRLIEFGHVEIREYPVILDDNPAVSEGAPIGIGWLPLRTLLFESIEAYEESRIEKPMKNLALTAASRKKRLKKAGYTLTQIEQASVDAQKIRAGREASVVLLGNEEESESDHEEEEAYSPVQQTK
jgi:hypothetical protein